MAPKGDAGGSIPAGCRQQAISLLNPIVQIQPSKGETTIEDSIYLREKGDRMEHCLPAKS